MEESGKEWRRQRTGEAKRRKRNINLKAKG